MKSNSFFENGAVKRRATLIILQPLTSKVRALRPIDSQAVFSPAPALFGVRR